MQVKQPRKRIHDLRSEVMIFNAPRLVFNNYEVDNNLLVLNSQGITFTYEFLSNYIGEAIIRKKVK